MADLGITGGIGSDAFGPDRTLGRGQMATLLARSLDLLREQGRGVLPRP
jgi:hypothetical protein